MREVNETLKCSQKQWKYQSYLLTLHPINLHGCVHLMMYGCVRNLVDIYQANMLLYLKYYLLSLVRTFGNAFLSLHVLEYTGYTFMVIFDTLHGNGTCFQIQITYVYEPSNMCCDLAGSVKVGSIDCEMQPEKGMHFYCFDNLSIAITLEPLV